MITCLLGLGSNLGDRCAILNAAIDQLHAHPQVALRARSEWFRTTPAGGPAEQDEFVNAAVCLETSLSPESLWALLREIEERLGRQRHERWGPRTVDLDLLLYGDRCQQTPQLTLPHPRMAFRRFVLAPASQVAPELLHPVLGRTIRQLLQHLDTTPNYLALTGAAGRGKTALAQAVAARLGTRLILTSDLANGGASARRWPQVVATRSGARGIISPMPGNDELDLLYRRAALLSDADGGADSAGTISDFWLGQSLAYGRLQLAEPARTALEAAWQRLPARVATPRLIVLLEADNVPAPDRAEQQPAPAAQASDVSGGRFDAELHALVCDRPAAPFLVLPAADRANALAEVTAAAQAMR
jgi:2-amino-4-hydroxy-6-hydroxymethyldihydropteridine diphosphokinase